MRSRDAVDLVERFVEGSATEAEFREAEASANAAADEANIDCSEAGALSSVDLSWACLYSAAVASHSAAYGICYAFEANPRAEIAGWSTACAVQSLAEAVAYAAGADQQALERGESASAAELFEQAMVLRDILRYPSDLPQPARYGERSSRLLTSLAVAAYEERLLPSGHLDNARLAVLSDALEEAGCSDEEILAHLRSPGPHIRGCWALDHILGKE
jgi:hypothetical protein